MTDPRPISRRDFIIKTSDSGRIAAQKLQKKTDLLINGATAKRVRGELEKRLAQLPVTESEVEAAIIKEHISSSSPTIFDRAIDKTLKYLERPISELVKIPFIQKFVLFTDPFKMITEELKEKIRDFKIPEGLKESDLIIRPTKIPRIDNRTGKKVFIYGYFLRPSAKPDSDTTVVIAHGRNSGVNEFGKSVTNIIKAGKNVFIGSYIGFAKNRGVASRRNMIDDFKAMLEALDPLNLENGVKNYKLEIAAHSLGTGTACRALVETGKKVHKLVLGSPFTTLKEVAEDLPEHPIYKDSFYHRNVLKLMGHGLRMSIDARDQRNKKYGREGYDWTTIHDLQKLIENEQIIDEVRVISGGMDYWVPPHMHAKVFELAGAQAELEKTYKFLDDPERKKHIPRISMKFTPDAGHDDVVLYEENPEGLTYYQGTDKQGLKLYSESVSSEIPAFKEIDL